jgi:hypothetical protein
MVWHLSVYATLPIRWCRARNPVDSALGGSVFMASLIPVSACQQVSELRSVSCLLAFLLQIIQQLPEHEHPESADMGVHWGPPWVGLGRLLGPSRGLIGAKSEG